jgi:hypothetical protein
MGRIAAELADVPIVTSDNPRSEDPGAIIDEILAGIDGDAEIIQDRRSAIAHASRPPSRATSSSSRARATSRVSSSGTEQFPSMTEKSPARP